MEHCSYCSRIKAGCSRSPLLASETSRCGSGLAHERGRTAAMLHGRIGRITRIRLSDMAASWPSRNSSLRTCLSEHVGRTFQGCA
jgi:hypothetical protein